MSIATGMLESLGLNMYTTIGKSLAEFVANAYDADATEVNITIPFPEIDAARKLLRADAKVEVAKGNRTKFTVLYDPLPEDLVITIKDDGHGMRAEDIDATFLRISRNRRESKNTSESGKRYVMGRKGLGKLAGFGAAQKVSVWTKRAGESFATEFLMDFNDIKAKEHLNGATFKANYYPAQPLDEHGTTIKLSGLRCDSLKSSEITVHNALATNFGNLGSSFMLKLNTTTVTEQEAEWEYTYPPEGRDAEGFASHTVIVDEDTKFDIRYLVRFRAREGDSPEEKKSDGGESTQPQDAATEKTTGSLPARQRGARIYCNGRLAAGPTLLNLKTGMHNFHSQSYMECIVHADEIDRQEVDHVSTNRADLKADNEIVERLYEEVTELMRKALYEHSVFRKEKVTQQVEHDDESKKLLKRVDGLSAAVKKSAKKVLSTLAEVHGVKSQTYKELAPIVMDGMNAGEVLTRLIELEADPQSIYVLNNELLELAKIENSDALKLYRGRKSAINALEKLVADAMKNWKSNERFEKRLHACLKDSPWLIQPHYSRALTSDKPMSECLQKLNVHLKIEDPNYEPPAPDEEANSESKQERPDLVFLLADSQNPSAVDIVELKSPNIPLNMTHLTQLKDYMSTIKEWARVELRRDISVQGYLIGTLDPVSQARNVKVLRDEIRDAGPTATWKVLTLHEMLTTARTIHMDALQLLDAEDKRLEELLS